MKILVIGHNVFSKTNNMGKTLSGYFKDWNVEDIAQFYIQPEIPTTHVSENYFRITDKDALKSIITRKCGRIFKKEDIDENANLRTDRGVVAKIYQKSSKRTPIIFLGRNLIWRLSGWKNKKLLGWVDEFSPDAVFFASGDYSFMYRIALEIAKYKKIPLFTACVDDYYFCNKNENVFLGKTMHRLFMKQVRKTIDYSSSLFVICDKMAKDYNKTFKKNCYTLHTSASFVNPLKEIKNNKISYLGNLDFKRERQLIEMGKTLLSLEVEGKPAYIDVYTAESRPEILQEMTHENGIHFCGKIDAEQVKKVMGQSLAVIHTESFDEEMRKRVRYSVSTKIADSLMSGTCLLAYGPEDVASMEYLIENEAAITITNPEELQQGLAELISNQDKRNEVIHNALVLAEKNHDNEKNSQLMKQIMMR